MTAAPVIVDRLRLCRLFRFIREHEDQAIAAGDDVRADKWERMLNKLVDLLPRC